MAGRVVERLRNRDRRGALLRVDRYRYRRVDRFPSAACGIVGLKPTWGRVSRHGVFPLGESLDHIGPMTRTVADAALVLGVIAGRDDADETSLAAPVEDYAAALDRGVKSIRIGVDEKYITAQASPEVATAVLDALRVLERLGGRIDKVKLPEVEAGIIAWTTICTRGRGGGT